MIYLILKRTTDIVVASIAILYLLPVFLIIILFLKITDEGKIFFFQQRVGFKNKHFALWKFRTMVSNSSSMGSGNLTVKNDPRITTMGRILRPNKLDELPQFINVLKGEISLVGPRPIPIANYEAYPEEIKRKIYDVKPGITGIGSLVFRNEEAILSASGEDPNVFYKREVAPYKGALEIWYQKNASTLTDFKLLILTGWFIIFPDSKLLTTFFKDLPKNHSLGLKQLEKVRTKYPVELSNS